MSDFNDQLFEKRLFNLKETQDSITALSSWCLQQREHHKVIVSTWLKVLKKVKIEQRLTLFYLANDVIQYSKRKSLQFVESWGTALQKATTMVRDDKVRNKILRLFKIWNERAIYDDVFLTDLSGLLSTNTKKNSNSENIEFQPNVMFEKMRQIESLEDKTDAELQMLNENPLNLNDVKNLNNIVKERRSSGTDVNSELLDGIDKLKSYISCLKQEISERTILLDLLEQGEKFYENQKKEAKVVSNAYKNFGNRVKNMKRKLDELIPTLPSPVPSPDINAPSPSPDNDFELPEDKTDYYNPSANNSFSQYNNSDYYQPPPSTAASQNSSANYDYNPSSFTSGFSSFIGSSSLPFDIEKSLFKQEHENSNNHEPNVTEAYEGNPIEVIGSTPAVPAAETVDTSVPPPLTPSQVPSAPMIKTSEVSITDILNMLKQPPPQVKQEVPSLPPPHSPESCLVPLIPPPLPPPMFDLEDFKSSEWLMDPQGEVHHTNQNNFVMNSQVPPPRLPLHLDTRHPPPVHPHSSYTPEPNTHPLPAKFPTWDSVDTPASPPSFEKESYMESPQMTYEDDSMGIDIDDRSLPVISRHRKDTDHRRNITDVDHRTQNRNLISLTGSPAIDTDYRSIPMPPLGRNAEFNISKSNNSIEGANTESVDMDLSEEEEDHSSGKALFKGSFNINTQKRNLLESPLVEPDTKTQYKPTMLAEPDPNLSQTVDNSIASSEASIGSLDIDPSLIQLDENAEKLLSSINIDTITNIKKVTSPTTPTEAPHQIPPVASSSPFTPRNTFNGTPRHRQPRPQYIGSTPRFRPHHYDGGFRRGGILGSPHRFSSFPRVERGVYRPRCYILR